MAKRTRVKDPLVWAKELAVLEMRLEGKSYGDVVLAGIYKSRSAAQDAYRRILADNVGEPAEEARQLELIRLDKLLYPHWLKALKGDIKHTNVVLDIMTRRSRYLGLDAAVKVDISDLVRSMAEQAGLDYMTVMAEATALNNQALAN